MVPHSSEWVTPTNGLDNLPAALLGASLGMTVPKKLPSMSLSDMSLPSSSESSDQGLRFLPPFFFGEPDAFFCLGATKKLVNKPD